MDTAIPNAARMYDFFLGGLHNYPADRALAQQVGSAYPALPDFLRISRAFLRRAVRYFVAHGVRQFLDLGSGLPAVGNVHEVAQTFAPRTKVVYVDIDATAVRHSRLMLSGNPNATVLQVDLRRPDEVLGHRDLRWQIDMNEPVAVLAVAVLHFVGGADDPATIMAAYGDRLAPGSYIALSHASADADPIGAAVVRELYQSTGSEMYFRGRPEIEPLFGGLQPIVPGIVPPNQWHPELADEKLGGAEPTGGYTGVAIKLG